MIEHLPAGIRKAFALASDAERLARESADEEIEVGEPFFVDVRDVTEVLVLREMRLVDGDCMWIYFRVSDAAGFWECLFDAAFKPADAGEE